MNRHPLRREFFSKKAGHSIPCVGRFPELIKFLLSEPAALLTGESGEYII